MHDHLATAAHLKSIQYAMAGDKEQWLALFAEDAVVHDPVGTSPHDPKGEGFRGKARLAEFWDTMIAPSRLELRSNQRIPCGPQIVAVQMSATNSSLPTAITTEMITIYETDASGQVTRLQAYWDLAGMGRALAAQGITF